jgi:hypothetical protein
MKNEILGSHHTTWLACACVALVFQRELVRVFQMQFGR